MTDLAWVALSLVNRVGLKTLHAITNHLGSASAALSADYKLLRGVPGIGQVTAKAICEIDLPTVAIAISRWQSEGINILTPDDKNYPSRLRILDDAPATLFVRGTLGAYAKGAALVGTRAPSPAAKKITQIIGKKLIEQGYTIISGLALGIDTLAHIAALETPCDQIPTFSVLGCGVSDIYPPANDDLASRVMERGAIMSELRPDAAVSAPGLVARNRIITGLSDIVIVVETEADGGAMHAARFARLQGKTLYTVDSPASGNRTLLAEGALPLDIASL